MSALNTSAFLDSYQRRVLRNASLLMDTLTLLNNKTYHHGDAFALAQVQQHLQALEMQTESLYGLVTRLHYNGDESNQTAKLEKKRDVSCGTTKQLKSSTSSLLLHKDKACASCGKKNTNQWRKGPKGSATLCNACGMRYLRQRKRGGTKAATELGSEDTTALKSSPERIYSDCVFDDVSTTTEQRSHSSSAPKTTVPQQNASASSCSSSASPPTHTAATGSPKFSSSPDSANRSSIYHLLN